MHLSHSKRFATIIGYCGLLLWTMAASLTAFVKSIPTFQLLSTTFGISFLGTVIYLTATGRWYKLKQPIGLWILGILGLLGTNIFYVYAFKRAPAEQADLIIYLWPILVVLFSGLLPKESFTAKHIVAAILGFIGAYFLITKGEGLAGFELKYTMGYLWALISALSWSCYTLVSRYYGKTPIEAIGIYYGFCMVFCLILHTQFETTVAPSTPQWLALLFMGATVYGLAYFFWDFGIGRGHFKLLSILSYGNPILSIGLLIVFGFAKPSIWLFVAALLVTLAGIVATLSWEPIWKRCQSIWQQKTDKSPKKYPLLHS